MGGSVSPPRRVSGAGRRPAPQSNAPRLVWRLGGAVHSVAEHRWLERLISGRAWIGVVGVGLIGIVFMQVSMLRMNAGIGRSVERAGVLERENAGLRAAISELSSGDRLAAEASKVGLVLPTSTPRFLDARTASARRALQSMTPPGEGIVALTATQADATSTAPLLAGTSVAPTSTTPMAVDGTAATPAPTTQEPVTTTTAPAGTAPAGTAPAGTAPAGATTPAAQPAASTAPAQTTAPPQETGGADAGQVG